MEHTYEPVPVSPSQYVSPLPTVQHGHEEHPYQKTRRVIFIIIVILIAALAVFFGIQAYKAHRTAKFEAWYQEQLQVKAEAALRELGSGGGTPYSFSQAETILKGMTSGSGSSQMPNETSIEEARVILKKDAEISKEEARKEFRNQN
jgi:hypothetical protein